MRIWHYKILSYLPKSQLIAQWRELNSIFKKQDKHILINYIYEYPKENLLLYTNYVMNEMYRRKIKINSLKNFNDYFKDCGISARDVKNEKNPFKNHHNNKYLNQCFYNLQEKYDRGQKDFSKFLYVDLLTFITKERIENEGNWRIIY